MSMLAFQGVTRTYATGPARVVALDDVSLAVAPGELVAVMGPSGSGKTTLLALAGGLDFAGVGEVVVDGQRLGDATAAELARLRRTTIGYVFQELNLVPSLTAAENVMLPLELDGMAPLAARPEALQALDAVGVSDLADRFPDDMSGGQQQRVAIARAVVGPRRLVLADEPTGALDSVSGEQVMRVLRGRCAAGAAGIVVTHDAGLAAWADRILFLRDGRLVDETQVPTPETALLAGGPA